MLIVHCADFHIGYRSYTKRDDDTGMNLRMKDMYDAFDHVCDFVTTRNDVGIMIVAGDFFNSIRPSNFAYNHIIGKLNEVTHRGIAVCIVGGNHDTPKNMYSVSPLDVIEHVDGVHVCTGDYHYEDIEGVRVHMVPYCLDKETLVENLNRAGANLYTGRNILALHGSVMDFKVLEHDEVLLDRNEVLDLSQTFDYVALGHYHDSVEVADHVWYAGSLERMSWNEKNDSKGFVVYDTVTKEVEQIEYDARQMYELEPYDVNDLPLTSSLTRAVLEHIEQEGISDKICRMKILNVPVTLNKSLDLKRLREATKDAAHFNFIFEMKEDEFDLTVERTSFKTLKEEWAEFAQKCQLSDEIRELGRTYIEEADQ